MDSMTYLLDPGVRDLAPEVIDAEGFPRIMPAAFYEGTTHDERAWLGYRHGLYGLPTVELCAWLRAHIADRSAIEIGAAHGRLAAELGIPATDSYLQDDPEIRAHFATMGQPPVRYGPNVERLEALAAVRKHRPQVVIGSWITHKYNRRRHGRGGNQHGPDTAAILERVDEYILIGNTGTHAQDPLWERPHDLHHFPWIYSRSVTRTPDFIAVWKGRSPRAETRHR